MKIMLKKSCGSSLSLFFFLGWLCLLATGCSDGDWRAGPLLPKNKRETIACTEYGEITAAHVSDGTRRGSYHLQFFTLEPNSLFLPVLLHTNMVFYVHTGSGRLNWASEEDEKMRLTRLRRGDVFRLKPGSVFYLQSNLETEREKLRIYALFVNLDGGVKEESTIGAYSSISDLLRGFDKKILQAAFQVSEELIEEITNVTKPPPIVHDVPTTKKNFWEWEARFLKAFIGNQHQSLYDFENKGKATKTFNIRDAAPDFENCNGRSLTVTRKDLKVLKGSNIGIFMVNLTKGSMMGPHWNPMATEIAVVIEGEGMVRVVCSGNSTNSTKSSQSGSDRFQCENMRFRVEEGDVFVVPRFHPMAQMSFNNGSFVFMGFSTTTKLNHPQFLAGESSVLRTLDKNVLAAAFNVSNTTISQFLTPQREVIILDCTSCAEKEERTLQEEIERKRQEEEAKKREEERKEEEEAKKKEEERKKEEEEARKKEEEEAKEREEEEEKQREKEEAKAKEREEEERQREREEAKAKERERKEKKEKEEKQREEEEDRRREEAAEKEQEEARREEEERKEGEGRGKK